MDNEQRAEKWERHLEAERELDRLKRRHHELRKILTPQAIMAVWLLLGDEMWSKEQ